MRESLRFYKDSNARTSCSFSDANNKQCGDLVQIMAYCLMGTHIHLLLKQLKADGISIFMNRVLNSYTRYFNSKCKRKGPLWEGRFKRILVDRDEYLLHLTRYIHLNPVTAYLVDSPEDWMFSSFNEYVGGNRDEGFCEFRAYLDMPPERYSEFVKSRIEDQRSIAVIKHLLLEEQLRGATCAVAPTRCPPRSGGGRKE
jgi:putative transposase